MEATKQDKPDESTIGLSEKLDQTVHNDLISQASTEFDLAKVDQQETPTLGTQSTLEGPFTTPNAHQEADLIEPQQHFIPNDNNNEPSSDIILGNFNESDDKTENLVDNFEPTTNHSRPLVYEDNGILEFVTVEEAIELYNRIHTGAPPKLDWKFYGRKVPGQEEQDKTEEVNNDKNETVCLEQTNNQIVNTEFDFDEDFGLESDTSIINESLQLKKRFEPGSEKKTNLSDIMSDIMKESHVDNR